MARVNAKILIGAIALTIAAAGCVKKAEKAAKIEPAALREETEYAPTPEQTALSEPPVPVFAAAPELNARRGRILFVTNGCVICHQANGVGGKAAPDLSADAPASMIDPLEFSARMWRGAPAMTALQTIELGYVIELGAQDIADLAAFAASPEEQALLTLDSVGAEVRTWFLDEPRWRSGDWTEYLKRGERIPGLEEETP